MISNYEIEFGNDFMIAVANEMKNAIKYGLKNNYYIFFLIRFFLI